MREQADDDLSKFNKNMARNSVSSHGSVECFLAKALERMDTPIVEGEIPVTRLETKLGSEKAEFRMIMQGRDSLSLVAHYAKSSLHNIAANISLGGHARSSQQVVRGIFQQKLKSKVSQDEINRRAGESFSKLQHVAERFGQEFAEKLAHSNSPRRLVDFAVDISPVWDEQAQDLRFFLLEVQYGYAFQRLRSISPSKAQKVQEFKEALAEERRAKQRNKAQQRFVNAIFGSTPEGSPKDSE